MTTRILPADEWPKLAETELGPALAQLPPASTTVWVVEHEGAIVGCWSLITFTHVEGLWIAPEHRKRGRVFARLWETLCGLALERGIVAVLTRATDDAVASWIRSRGGCRLPGDGYTLPIHSGRGL